ncbi:lactate utilization protein [Cloacibacillus evryensis]|uniref:lactate utilization protein n=1 Tax=Cloacibacillus evryensis TaxID=508460 RepID=UPI003AB18AE3
MNTSEAKKTSNRKLGESICKALETRGFSAQYTENAEAACERALELIEDGASVGIPGTVTVREIGLPERLEEKGCKIAEHWLPNMTREERKAALIGELEADWFVTSANALAMDGTIVNIDGTGNRVGVMAWAPGKILYIIGVNKIASDVDSALKRARSIASPPNAVRIGMKTPCTVVGRCMDCNSPDRICRVVTMMERAPIGRECHVIIVGEELGY